MPFLSKWLLIQQRHMNFMSGVLLIKILNEAVCEDIRSSRQNR